MGANVKNNIVTIVKLNKPISGPFTQTLVAYNGSNFDSVLVIGNLYYSL